MAGTLQLPTLSQEYRLNTAGFHKGVDEVKGGTEKMRGAFEGVRKVVELVGIGIGVAEGAKFLKESIERAREVQRTERVTAALLKSTGGVAHVTARQIDEVAKAQSEKLGIDKETIAKGEQVLLTFTNVRNELGKGNDIYNQSVVAAENMSTVLGTDLVQSTRLVGKALQDPAHGLTMLRRAGIVFTDQQKKMITGWVAQGKTLTAQKFILDQLTHRFGGAAAAAADPIARLHVMWQNLEEELGRKLLPVVNAVVTWIGEYLPKGIDLAVGAIKTAVYWVRFAGAIIAAAFNGKDLAHTGYPLVTAFALIGSTARRVWDRVLVPIGNWLHDHWRGTLIVAAVATAAFVAPLLTLAATLVYVWTHFKVVRDVVHTVIDWLTKSALPRVKQFFSFISREVSIFVAWWSTRWKDIRLSVEHVMKAIEIFLAPALLALKYLWDAFGKNILAELKIVWNLIVSVFKDVFAIIKGIFDVFLGLLSGDWGRAWDGVKQIFSAAWDLIVSLLHAEIATILNVFSALAGQVVGILKSIGTFIWNSALLPALTWVRDRILDAVNLWLDIYVRFPLRVVAAIANFGQVVWGGITAGVSWLKDRLQQGVENIISFFTGMPHRIVSGLANIGTAIWNGVKTGLGWLHDRFSGVADSIVSFFTGIPGKIGNIFGAIVGVFKSGWNAFAGWWNNNIGGKGFTVPGWVPVFGGDSVSVPSLPEIHHAGGIIGSQTPGGAFDVPMIGARGEGVLTAPTVSSIMRDLLGRSAPVAATTRASSSVPQQIIENQHIGDVITVTPSEATFDERNLESLQRRQRLRSRPIPA